MYKISKIILLIICFLTSCNFNNTENNVKEQKVQGQVFFNNHPVEGVEIVLVKVEEITEDWGTSIRKEWLYNFMKDVVTDENGVFILESEDLINRKQFEVHLDDYLYEGFAPFVFNFNNNNIEIRAYKTDLEVVSIHNNQYLQDQSPFIEWKPYNNASYYTFELNEQNRKIHNNVKKIYNTTFKYDELLVYDNWYEIKIEAFTVNDIKIAQNVTNFYIGDPLIPNAFQGLVSWNNKGEEGISLSVLDDSNTVIKTITDKNGFYVLTQGDFTHGKRYRISVENNGEFVDEHHDLDDYVTFYSDGSKLNFEIVKKLEIEYPQNYSILSETNPTFKWEKIDDVTNYHVVLCKNRDDNYQSYSSTDAVFYLKDININTYKHNENLEIGKKYTLIIWGKNEDYNTIVENYLYFEILK